MGFRILFPSTIPIFQHPILTMSASRNAWVFEVVRLLILLCICGCATSSIKPSLSVDAQAGALSHFSLGLLAEADGDSAAALQEIEAAIQLDPGAEILYASAAAIALKLGRTEDAIRIARQLKKRHPETPDSLLLLARVTAITGETAEAENLFKQAVSNFQENQDALLSLARFFISQNRLPEAVQTLESAMKPLGETADLLHLLGTLIIESAREQTDPKQVRETTQQGLHWLEKSIETDSSDPQRWQQAGSVYLSLEQLDQALDAFKRALIKLPADVALAQQVLNLELETGNFDRALELCDTLPAQTGTDPELWLQYLIGKTTDEHFDQLITYLKKQLLQKKPPVFYSAQLSSIYLDRECYAEAEATLLKAMAIHPADSRLRTVRGTLRLRQENYDEAYADFRRVRDESPKDEWIKNPFFAYTFMVAAQKSGHLEEAAATLVTTYTHDPFVLNQYMHSLLTGTSPVSTQAAIDLLNVFHRMSPKATEALYYLALLQAGEKDYETALENARSFEVLAQDQGNTNLLNGFFYYQYASLCERTGRLEEAEKLFFKTIEQNDPEMTAAAQNYVAYMWAERGEKLDQALPLIEKALTLKPDNAAFMDTRGWIYYMQGRYEEALDQLNAASKILHDDPTLWEHLGDTWLKLGNRDEASKHWKKALELKPDDEQPLLDRIGNNPVSPMDRPAEENGPEGMPPRP